MRTHTLGLAGIICSPFMAIMLHLSGIFENHNPTSLAAALSLIYMTGWFCSIIGLYQLNAAGYKKGRIVLLIQMMLLTVGNLWNIYSIIDPECNTIFFHIADLIGWPLDNIFMIVTGIAVASARQLQGWKRFVPLFAGFWFPVTVVLAPMLFGTSSITLMITSLYSTIFWALLGLTVYLSAGEKEATAYTAVRYI